MAYSAQSRYLFPGALAQTNVVFNTSAEAHTATNRLYSSLTCPKTPTRSCLTASNRSSQTPSAPPSSSASTQSGSSAHPSATPSSSPEQKDISGKRRSSSPRRAARTTHRAPRLDFFLMHVLTSVLCLPTLVASLTDKAQLLRGYARTSALFVLLRGRSRIDIPLLMLDAVGSTSATGETHPWLVIGQNVLHHKDAHVIKAVRALYYSAQRYGATLAGGAIGARGKDDGETHVGAGTVFRTGGEGGERYIGLGCVWRDGGLRRGARHRGLHRRVKVCERWRPWCVLYKAVSSSRVRARCPLLITLPSAAALGHALALMGGVTTVPRVLKEMSARANTTKASIEAFPSSNGTGTAQSKAGRSLTVWATAREMSVGDKIPLGRQRTQNRKISLANETLPGGRPVFVDAELSRLKSVTFALTKFVTKEVPSKFAQEMSTMTYKNARAFGPL
ncbi:hypothetical protein DFH09DRAFT_1309699 [Mycena vulgaris]|nr:hypothetical protein DFH09DRAFT_1309699 [Mycena vulgaris]